MTLAPVIFGGGVGHELPPRHVRRPVINQQPRIHEPVNRGLERLNRVALVGGPVVLVTRRTLGPELGLKRILPHEPFVVDSHLVRQWPGGEWGLDLSRDLTRLSISLNPAGLRAPIPAIVRGDRTRW